MKNKQFAQYKKLLEPMLGLAVDNQLPMLQSFTVRQMLLKTAARIGVDADDELAHEAACAAHDAIHNVFKRGAQ